NNAYCQDNELSWLDWSHSADRESLLTFVQRVIALRHAHPIFRRRKFFEGRAIPGSDIRDVSWHRPDGLEMTSEDWGDRHARCLAMLVSGSGISELSSRGQVVHDDDFLLLFNSHHDEVCFTLPNGAGQGWRRLIDTARDPAAADPGAPPVEVPQAPYPVECRSFVLLNRPRVVA
ncbi:MAG: glycogen debranching enzyme GlgX, partial [Ramlibacter sp.]